AGETLATIATRVGLTAAQILTRVFRWNGAPVTAATQNTLAANERLLIEGIYYHDVMSGETAASIATMWGIPEASLRRANPALAAAGSQPTAGQRLLIPAS
ncbi:MAG TPA: LysM domain-containing protein, partial [Pyrinomonadaceae bacterium]